jgi:glycyl-tRNA synthetase beta chain
MKDFLLEIGCENLPSSYVQPAVEQMRLNAGELLHELRLSHDDIYATGTPRRLVLIIKDLASVQEEKTETVTGPPAAKGFDANGRPTKAALGFAKANGIPVSKLQTIPTDRGDYLGFKRSLKSRKAELLLQESLPGLITGLKFPKVMRWESSGVRFARPIRWLVCLHGKDVVKLAIAGVSSSNVSYRVPWLDKEKIRIPSASLYLSEMKKRGIIVESEKRREKLEHLAEAASAKAGLDLVDDPDLLEEISYMVEEPGVLIGEFPMEYLALPSEVIITAMKAHQRYFALRNTGNKLVPRFLAFYDGKKASRSHIKKGNERVLIARLEDAHFYWREDLKKGIQGLAGKLDAIVFVEGLGSMKDKSKRIAQVMEFIDDSQVKRAVQPDVIERLSMLAKADLASDMIKDGKEFTLLEGLIGGHYAREAGEAPEIVQAIKEQYYPRSPSDPIPKTIPGIYLNIADKIDTICGCFLAGLFPTGSQDPYGLRRQAFGLIRISLSQSIRTAA